MSETEHNAAAEQQVEVAVRERIAYAICALSDIPSQKAKGYHLAKITEDGREAPFWIIIVRWGKQVFGYVNRCPHDGVNLDWERGTFLDGNGIRLQCGKHGALFELGTGMCIDGAVQGPRPHPCGTPGDRQRDLRAGRASGGGRARRRRTGGGVMREAAAQPGAQPVSPS